MRKKKMMVTVLAIVMCTCALTGCGKSDKEKRQLKEPQTEKQSSEVEVSGIEASEIKIDEKAFDFAALANLEFCFCSGAGGWSTSLVIDEDGSFEGYYSDSDMGSTGEGYPNGTRYVCDFTGQFSQPEQVDEYTYKMKLENIKLSHEPGAEEIKDEIKYVASEPYGLENAVDIMIYLPGTPVAQLPKEYMDWVNYTEASKSTELTFYGLYNVVGENGFSSYEKSDNTTSTEDDRLKDVETKAAALEKKLEEESLTQTDMNSVSGELYQLWDDELNTIWGELKETLDEAAMATLLDEQRAWITSKEEAVTAAGAEYEGGSIQPLIENSKAAELTKVRVYELVKLLP